MVRYGASEEEIIKYQVSKLTPNEIDDILVLASAATKLIKEINKMEENGRI